MLSKKQQIADFCRHLKYAAILFSDPLITACPKSAFGLYYCGRIYKRD
jgi:hypothetical protein